MDRWAASARSPASAATSPIASQGKACAQHFHQLCTLLEDAERQAIYGISHLQVSECSGQFRIWAGNIGALQSIPSASSLDYRLREVPKVSKQVLSLLEDLEEALADVIAIASGERENRVSSPVPFNSEFLDDEGASWGETVSGGLEPASGPTSEIQELFQSIPETITSLFKLSILIRNSSSRDRYAKAISSASKAHFNEQFDIDHVGNKFPRLYRDDREWLRQRLGKAITQKRQYLRYCREHREKLSKLPETSNTTEALSEPKMGSTYLAVQGQQSEAVSDAQTVVSRPTSTLAPTTASTVVPAKFDHLEKLEEQNEDDNRSQTSYATSVNEYENDNRLSVVRLEEVAGNTQSFECPYCWTIQRINNQHAWRKHVMRDLKPYVCTWEECDMKLFPDRYTWFIHELQNHLVEWNCCFCSHVPYQTRDKFDKHVRKSHANKVTDNQLPALVKACQKPVDKLPATACPFCDDWEARLKELNQHLSADEILVVTPQQFRHHVGSHMEQLALFAIPRGYKEDGDADSGGAVPGHGSSSSSNRSLVRPDYEDEDNPRLHIAAFQGLREEVKAFLDGTIGPKIGIVPPILLNEGSTWGSALSAAAAGGHVDIAYLCMPRELSATVPSYYLDSLPRSKSKGWGPLHWAASNGHLAMSSFLTENGMSVRDRAFDGSTAVDLARRHGHEEIVQLLESTQRKPLNVQPNLENQEQTQHDLQLSVIAATGLVKRDIFSLPDPYAIVKLNGIEIATTAVHKKSVNPSWNEAFRLSVTKQSRIKVEIFDEKKPKKANTKDSGYLGGIHFEVGDVINIDVRSRELITPALESDMQSIDVKGYLTLILDSQWVSRLATETVSPLPVFGLDLYELFYRDESAVPLIVYHCIEAVDLYGMEVEGIYHLSGTQSHVDKMRDMFDTDASKVDFSDPANFFHDVNSVAALLKLFFRELPDPLMTGELYEEFMEAAKVVDDVDRRNSIHGIVNRLPDPNYATLRALVLHLNRVAEASSKNLMKARDLAIIFAPTIFRGKGVFSDEDIGLQVRVVDTILYNTFWIFDDDDED